MSNSLYVTSFVQLFNFIILGILFPNNYIGALILAILWELLEECFTKRELSIDVLTQHFNDYQHLWQDNKKNKVMDLFISMVGYYVGTRVRGFSPL